MKVKFKVLNGTAPVKATIVGTILPVSISTDSNGESFAIAPIIISPAKYLLDIVCFCKKVTLHISDIADEVKNYYIIDLKTKTWSKEPNN